MRHALYAVLFALLLAPLGALTACGGGGGAGSGNPEDARAALITVLDAVRRDDVAKARAHMDVVEWLSSMDHPQASTYTSLRAKPASPNSSVISGRVHSRQS